MTRAGDDYARCLTVEADARAGNPAVAEEIAVAAHAQCWAQWQHYREITHDTFAASARTPEQDQLARDKADAHLRQFEHESRRTVVNRIVEGALRKPRP